MVNKLPLQGLYAQIVGTAPQRLSVTNFAASLCEIQGFYRHKKVPVVKSLSQMQALDRGSKAHAKLDLDALPQLQVPWFTPEIKHAEYLRDISYRWSLFARTGKAREVPLFGEFRGIRLFGVADELMDAGILEDKTTWKLPAAEYKVRLALHQTLVYLRLYRELMQGIDILPFIDRGYDLDKPLVPEQDMHLFPGLGGSLRGYHDAVLESYETLLAAGRVVGPHITLRFQNSLRAEVYEFEHDAELENQLFRSLGELWHGEREPMPFKHDGSFSCRTCEYRRQCEFTRRYPTALAA